MKIHKHIALLLLVLLFVLSIIHLALYGKTTLPYCTAKTSMILALLVSLVSLAIMGFFPSLNPVNPIRNYYRCHKLAMLSLCYGFSMLLLQYDIGLCACAIITTMIIHEYCFSINYLDDEPLLIDV